jgi:hypothetical protein
LSGSGDEDKKLTLKAHLPLLEAPLVVGALCFARLAGAREATEPIRIEYRAEAGCPSADEFNDQVFRRTASARLATSGELSRTFVVSIERHGSGLQGSLVVRQADGTTESREVAGPECSEVAKVLALATALAIDPEASLAPNPEPSAPRPEPAAPVVPEHAETTRAPHETSGEPSAHAWVVTLGPVIEAAITPRPAYGGSVGVGWRAPHGLGALSAAGVDVTYLRAPTHAVGTAAASFQFLYARPALCAVSLDWQLESGIAPCLSAEIGAVTGAGSNITHASTRSRVWATVDPALELHQALGAGFFAEAVLAAVLPVTRYQYVFREPTTHVYTVPGAAVYGALRLGVRWF